MPRKLTRTLAQLTCAAAVATGISTAAVAEDDEAQQKVEAEQFARQGLRAGMAGEVAARKQSLRRAVQADANCRLARWHLGQLQVNDQWLGITDYTRQRAEDPQLREYRQRRDQALQNPEDELELANWCARQTLPDAEQLHLNRVVQFSSDAAARAQAMKRLGLQLHQGMLLSADEMAELQQQAAAQQQNLKDWTRTVEKWRKALSSGRPRQQAFARRQLRSEADVSAIAALETILSVHSEPLALEVVATVGRMPAHEATMSLVRHGLDASWESVRQEAAQQLSQRPLHDYAPLVLRELVPHVQSRFLVNVGPDGLVRHTHQFLREGAQENHLLTAAYVGGPVPVPRRELIQGAAAPGPRGQNARRRLAAARAEQAVQLQEARERQEMVALQETLRAAHLQQQVARANELIAQKNERVYAMLEQATGKSDLPRAPDAWWEWWQKYNELYQEDKPTYQHQVGRVDPYYVPWTQITTLSCFPAGTPVRTETGLVSIDEIQVGDRVLSQDVETGELAYKLVLQTTQRPPSDLLEMSLDDSTLVTTKGHLFWVNGIGWRMAKQLQGGEQIHSVRGGHTVADVQSAAPAKAYNLVVADFHNYFVGDSELLVHDNTYRKPTRALTPGLRPSQTSRSQ